MHGSVWAHAVLSAAGWARLEQGPLRAPLSLRNPFCVPGLGGRGERPDTGRPPACSPAPMCPQPAPGLHSLAPQERPGTLPGPSGPALPSEPSGLRELGGKQKRVTSLRLW